MWLIWPVLIPQPKYPNRFSKPDAIDPSSKHRLALRACPPPLGFLSLSPAPVPLAMPPLHALKAFASTISHLAIINILGIFRTRQFEYVNIFLKFLT
jgi:hypothetical protein